MINEDAKHALEMVAIATRSQSRHSKRTVRTNRSATPLACGARNGVQRTSSRRCETPRQNSP